MVTIIREVNVVFYNQATSQHLTATYANGVWRDADTTEPFDAPLQAVLQAAYDAHNAVSV